MGWSSWLFPLDWSLADCLAHTISAPHPTVVATPPAACFPLISRFPLPPARQRVSFHRPSPASTRDPRKIAPAARRTPPTTPTGATPARQWPSRPAPVAAPTPTLSFAAFPAAGGGGAVSVPKGEATVAPGAAGAAAGDKVSAAPLNFAAFPDAPGGESVPLPSGAAEQAEGKDEAAAAATAEGTAAAASASSAPFSEVQAEAPAPLPADAAAPETGERKDEEGGPPEAAAAAEGKAAAGAPLGFASFPVVEADNPVPESASAAQHSTDKRKDGWAGVAPGAAVEEKTAAPPVDFAAFPALQGEKPAPEPSEEAQQTDECKDEEGVAPGEAVDAAPVPAGGTQRTDECEDEEGGAPGAAVEEKAAASPVDFVAFPGAERGESTPPAAAAAAAAAAVAAAAAQQADEWKDEAGVAHGAATEEKEGTPPVDLASPPLPVVGGEEPAVEPAGEVRQADEWKDEAGVATAAMEGGPAALTVDPASSPEVQGDDPPPELDVGADDGARQPEGKDEESATAVVEEEEEEAAAQPAPAVQDEKVAPLPADAVQESGAPARTTAGTGEGENEAATAADAPLVEPTPPAATAAEGPTGGRKATKKISPAAFKSLFPARRGSSKAGTVVTTPTLPPAAASSPTYTEAWEDVGQTRSLAALGRRLSGFAVAGASLATPTNSEVSSLATPSSSRSAVGEDAAAAAAAAPSRFAGLQDNPVPTAVTEPVVGHAKAKQTASMMRDSRVLGTGGAVAVAVAASAVPSAGDDKVAVQENEQVQQQAQQQQQQQQQEREQEQEPEPEPEQEQEQEREREREKAGAEKEPASADKGGEQTVPDKDQETKASPGLQPGEPAAHDAPVAGDHPPRPAPSAVSEDSREPPRASEGNGEGGTVDGVPGNVQRLSAEGGSASGAKLASEDAGAVVGWQERAPHGEDGSGGEEGGAKVAISCIVLAGPAGVFSITAAARAHVRSPLLGAGASVISVASSQEDMATVAIVDLWNGGATTRCDFRDRLGRVCLKSPAAPQESWCTRTAIY